MRCIVSTRPDGGVTITHPTQETMAFLTNGGAPVGYYGRNLDRDWEIQKFVNAGLRESVAAKWIDALISGGRTDAEAYELIRDKDTKPDWSGHELWDRNELPDRWFRDGWARSHNGGPISIHLGRAKAIQLRHIKNAVAEENNALMQDLDCELIELDFERIRRSIMIASDENQLRSVWPMELSSRRLRNSGIGVRK